MRTKPSPDQRDQRDTIVSRVLRSATLTPDATALVSELDAWSYGELGQRIIGAAHEIRRRPLHAGDRVIVPASNTPHFVMSYLAVHFCGGIAVPVDAGAPKARLEYIRNRTAARLLLTGNDQRTLLDQASKYSVSVSEAMLEGPSCSSTADIMFTSGTTGSPKGVVLSHENIARAADRINAFVGTRQDDVELLALPLAHSFGLGSLRCVLSAGAYAVLVEGFAFPGQIFEALERHRATGFRCVPAGLSALFRLSRDKLGEFADNLRYLELGSAPMPIEDKLRLMRLLPHTRLCMHYGLTEATRSVYIEFHRDSERLDSVGRPTSGVDVRICGEHGETLPDGESGEIRIRGTHVMQGYWNDPQRSAETLEAGWLRTGDFGYSEQRGYLYLQGRRTDMINVGGRKVSPLEVEQALLTHPQVIDCACTAIADPGGLSGEAVAVLVTPSNQQVPDERELRKHLRQALEPYKIPTRWAFSGDIPRTSNGKVQRHLLREQLEIRQSE